MTTTFKFSKMKKTINIFVAGAKDLKNERNALKALAHELNTSYEDRKININLKIRSYEDFRDNQIEYNNFIENEADVAIFVLKDRIGKHTEEEFINAASAYNRKKIPEIIVFLNKDRKETQEVAHIQELLQEHLGNHYFVEYSDDDDLKAKARKRIDRFIRPTFRMNSRAGKWTIATLFCLMLLFAGLFVWSNYFKENKSLLFVGGGSALNYIKKNHHIDIQNYPNSIYASMPSSIARSMLGEEYNRHLKNYNFVTVCLSAGQADTLELLKNCNINNFNDEANIVECYLGEDTMAVFVQEKFISDYPHLIAKEQKTITPKALYNLISEQSKSQQQIKARFFCTNLKSGTRDCYNSYLIKECGDTTVNDMSEINNSIGIFNERDGEDNLINNNYSYILMGSKCYYPFILDKTDFQENRYRALLLVDEKNNILSKPIYLYFVAFRNPNNRNYIDIPKPIFKLLKEIDITNTVICNSTDKDFKSNGKISAGNVIKIFNKRDNYVKEQ